MLTKSFSFVDRLVGSIDLSSQEVRTWTPYAEHLYGIKESKALGKGCFALFRSKNLSAEHACRKSCIAAEHFRVDEVYNCPSMDVSRTLKGATRAKMLGIPVINSAGQFSVDLYAWPEKNAITVLPSVRIRALGSFRLSNRKDGVLDCSKWHRKQSERLLRLLVVCRRAPVHRDVLIDAMWPDIDSIRGWARLRVILHGLRSELAREIERRDLIVKKGEAYGLNRDAFGIDVDAFELAASEARSYEQTGDIESALACYEEADRLYTGDLFADTPYEAFVEDERRRLCQMAYDVRRKLREYSTK